MKWKRCRLNKPLWLYQKKTHELMGENTYCNMLAPSRLKIEVILTHTDIVAFFFALVPHRWSQISFPALTSFLPFPDRPPLCSAIHTVSVCKFLCEFSSKLSSQHFLSCMISSLRNWPIPVRFYGTASCRVGMQLASCNLWFQGTMWVATWKFVSSL